MCAGCKFEFYIILKMKIPLLIFNIALIILKCIKHITFETSLIFETKPNYTHVNQKMYKLLK